MKEKLWRISYFESIALIDISSEPIMGFDNFLNEMTWEFNSKKQIECIENNIFSDQELKYLLYIYILMNRLLLQKQWEHVEWKIDIWVDWTLEESGMIDIKKFIVRLLSLPSMKNDMDIIRKNPSYKWIWDFY